MLKIALVTHAGDGGVWSVTRFLYQILDRSDEFSPELYILATSSRDQQSVRLLAPRTWAITPRIIKGTKFGYDSYLAGAMLTEFEFQRYKPRRALTQLLDGCELVQVVGGTPAWASVALDCRSPVAVFSATTAINERATLIEQSHGWHKAWLSLMTRFTTRIERQALRSADVVFAESNYTRELLRPYVDISRLKLGPPGVDVRYFVPLESYQTNGHLLAVGRFTDPRKQIRLLIEAFARLVKSHPTVPRLIIAGSTGLTIQDVMFAEQMGVADRIDVLTNVSHEQLRELYRHASIFVLSSDEEGLGIVILEAMACGLPVVSTDCGGPATAIVDGATGYLTPTGDARALAERLERLWLDSNLRQRMGRAGRQRAEDCFSLEAAGRVYLEAYQSMLNKQRG